jgi:hypothetical protein
VKVSVAVLLCATVACGGARSSQQNVESSKTPTLGISSVAEQPRATQLSPCDLAAEVVAERVRQTTAEAAMEAELAHELVERLHSTVQQCCQRDTWSAITLACYRESTVDADPLVTCADTLSVEQQDRLTADVEKIARDIKARMH